MYIVYLYQYVATTTIYFIIIIIINRRLRNHTKSRTAGGGRYSERATTGRPAARVRALLLR